MIFFDKMPTLNIRSFPRLDYENFGYMQRSKIVREGLFFTKQVANFN